MNDGLKTFLFLLAAVLVLIPAVFLTLPQRDTFTAQNMVQQELFPALKNVMDVASLSIREPGKSGGAGESGKSVGIEVKKVEGRWILPSYSGYPANAQNRMAEVVSSLMNLEVLRVAGDDAQSRAVCGVLEPEDPSAESAAQTGRRIVLRDAQDRVLLDMILGTETEEGSGKYYVRRTGQNPVYVVEMDPSKLTTRFLDWIETDLLKVQPADISMLFALDCTLDLRAQDQTAAFNHRGQFTVQQAYMENPDWTLTSNLRMMGENLREMGMPTGKTLDLEMLRHVSQALADMRICSVQRKPAEIVKAFQHPENISLTEEQKQTLMERGFCVLPMNLGNGSVNALFSTDGQTHVYTKDGILYRLFFGGIAGQEVLEDFAGAGDRKFYRYLVLTADLYPQGLPQPNLQQLQEKPADEAEKASYEALAAMNAQEQKIYEEALNEARNKVDRMNVLFADWFFIIPEDVFSQIHMTYDNVFISEEEAAKRAKEASDAHEVAHEHSEEDTHSEEAAHSKEAPEETDAK